MFLVLKGRRIIVYVVLFVIIIFSVFYCWSWLNTPDPAPRIGVAGFSDALIHDLFPNTEMDAISLGEHSDLLNQLNQGKLDYLLELDKPTANLKSWQVGELIPVVVVPFFDFKNEISLEELITTLKEHPAEILVSDVLALPTFPWSDQPVQYLSSLEVIEGVHSGKSKYGLLHLQDRRPQVKVLPLTGIDPDALNRKLFLSRTARNVLGRIKERYSIYMGRDLDHIRLVPLNTEYTDPLTRGLRFTAVGDIMLNRDVKKEALKMGWDYIFSEVAPHIQSADLAFANLESPIGDQGHFINMFQAPPEAINGLASAGFDVVSLANNHTLDYHIDGMFETMRLLREYGIDYVGAGQDIQAARAPLIREINGTKVGFLSYTEMWFVHAREPISWQATHAEPGVAPAELAYVVEDVARLRDLVDVVIVTVHWGKEYVHEPTPEQQILARAAVDAGADLVLGHHPHVLQGIEFYKQGVIVYSLGNFVFDLNLPKTWETMILDFTLAPSGALDLTIIPAYIFGVQPHIIEGAHRQAVYSQIRNYSFKLR